MTSSDHDPSIVCCLKKHAFSQLATDIEILHDIYEIHMEMHLTTKTKQ